MASESDISEKMDEVKITSKISAGDIRFRFVLFSSDSINEGKSVIKTPRFRFHYFHFLCIQLYASFCAN